ncbi:Multidrug resistance protein abc superfamily [Globisporangium polare]
MQRKGSQQALVKRSTSNDNDVRDINKMETADTEDSAAGDKSAPQVSAMRLWELSLPEWKYMILGGFGAILNAAVFPLWDVLLVKMTVLFFQYEKTKHDLLVDARYWSLAFVCLGVVFSLASSIQGYGFGVASQNLVSRVRLAAFSAMPRQEIGWFDSDENSSGALVSRLATDSAILQAQTSDTMNDADTAAGSLLSEAIGSIRTVASFSMEKASNAVYAGWGIKFLNQALLFWLSGLWVSKGTITFEAMFMVIMVITLSSLAVGTASQNTADKSKAKRAAARVFKIIDRVPEIDATSGVGLVPSRVFGDIEFKILAFTYPSRPDAQIYKDYSLKIARGQTVALVGASGSGKSTAISLLEGFYDPSSGVVALDGTDLRDLSLAWVRSRISLVSQEPVLFAGTIAENTAMGKPGATREEVVEAAKIANAFDFIRNSPNGLDTDVGDRGAQVSGGQKQRIAIARAILRDPEVLLLDEATSALDNESERVVQESLDRLLALKQRTTIIVAHRLSTIRNADMIAVTSDGAIVEQGTHDELVRLPQGRYKALVSKQMGSH